MKTKHCNKECSGHLQKDENRAFHNKVTKQILGLKPVLDSAAVIGKRKCIKEEVVLGFKGLAAEVQLWNWSSERSDEWKSNLYKSGKKKWTMVQCAVTGGSHLLTTFG